MGVFSIFFLFFVWSLAFPLGKQMLAYTTPIFAVSLRMVLGGLIILAFLYFRKQIPKLSKKQLLSMFVLAFFSIYATNILEFWSLMHLSAAKACFLYSLSPFLTAVLSYFHFAEKMTRKKVLGLVIGFLGFLPVIIQQTGTEGLMQAFSFFTWPEIAMFGAVFFSVYGWILLRIIVRGEDISPPLANGLSMLIGGFLAFGTTLALNPTEPFPVVSGGWAALIPLVILLTFLSNIFCYNLYGYLLKKYTATLLSLFGLLSPVFASFHSWIILKETPSLVILGSTFIVLLGLYIVYREEQRLGYIQEAT